MVHHEAGVGHRSSALQPYVLEAASAEPVEVPVPWHDLRCEPRQSRERVVSGLLFQGHRSEHAEIFFSALGPFTLRGFVDRCAHADARVYEFSSEVYAILDFGAFGLPRLTPS